MRVADPAIEAAGLRKFFGPVCALNGVDLRVAAGTTLGLLGPNGAGKTTAIRILTTLLAPDAGRARVAGFDVGRDARSVRRSIGVAGQYAAVDGYLSALENLEVIGCLYHLGRVVARRRAEELVARVGLSDVAHRLARTYSSGMRRRLDLAASIVASPLVLFLDEPTTGLDPESRRAMWAEIRALAAAGTTVMLTTQYLEEADRLATRIAVIDAGRVIAEGTSAQLKQTVGGARLEVRTAEPDDSGRAAETLARLGTGPPVIDHHTGVVALPVHGRAAVVVEAARRLEEARVGITDIGLKQPTLDDVFFALTRHGTPGGRDVLYGDEQNRRAAP
jgi:ABC-2 type transport system ATP-binding protein